MKALGFSMWVAAGMTAALTAIAEPVGDLNGDGKITRADAAIVLRHAVSSVVLGDAERMTADINGDGTVNAQDAIMILQRAEQSASGLWESFQATAAVDGSAVEVDVVFGVGAGAAQPDGVLRVRLLDLAGQELDATQVSLETSSEGWHGTGALQLPSAESGSELTNFILEFETEHQGAPVRERVSLFSIVPRLEVHVFGADTLAQGGRERVRIVTEEGSRDQPLPGVEVTMVLDFGDGNDSFPLFSGFTDDLGIAEARFNVPVGLSGSGELVVSVDSDLGTALLRQDVELMSGVRTLLTTDKPLYQPGQVIHIRTLSLSKPDHVPAAGEEIVLSVADSKGNKVFKQVTEVNDFGVAFTDFTLASELNLGAYKVIAAIGDYEVEKQVTVERYVLPKFKVDVQTEREYYAPGALMEGHVAADYFFGKPVAGAAVTVTASKFDVEFEPFAEVSGSADAQGRFDFDIDLPSYFVGQPLQQGDAFVLLEVSVIDDAAHEEKITRTIPVAASAIVIRAVAESGRLIPGVDNKVYLLTTYPNNAPARTDCSVSVDGQPLGNVTTDEAGIGVLWFTPAGASDVVLSVHAADTQGNVADRSLALGLNRAADGLLLRTDRTLYAVGDEVRVDVFATGQGGSIFVDVLREGQTIYGRALEPEPGRTSLVIPLSEDMSGTLTVSAYRITAGSDTVRDRRIIYVDRADDLELRFEADKETYRPGEDARLTVRVSDVDDRPVVAAVGLNIVDESVFALQEMQPGMEKVYFYLEEQLRQPRYEIHGFDPESLISQPAPENPELWRDRALGFMFASIPTADAGRFELSSVADVEDAVRRELTDAVWKDLGRLIEALNSELTLFDTDQPASFFDRIIQTAVGQGDLSEEDAADPWGRNYRIGFEANEHKYVFQSAGPDKRWGTADDLSMELAYWMLVNPWFRENPEWIWQRRPDLLVAVNAVANAEFPEDWDDALESPPSAGGGQGDGGEAPYLRQYFPETLYANPLLITGPGGSATVELKMADSITTWRLTGLASDLDGRLGSATAAMRVFQEFFVDIDLPATLTRGDEVSVPVAIYNYLPEAQDIRLAPVLDGSGGIELLDAAEKVVRVDANQVTVEHFRIKTKLVGRYPLQVNAFGSTRSDAIAREIEIVPDGSEVVISRSGRLGAAVHETIVIPDNAIEGASKIFVKVYPGFFSQVVEGLDSMLRMPFGCFEQTSSVTYPNVLAVHYMKTTGQITPEILLKAEGFISTGYQRLLSYEVEGGGFEWFGNAPAHNVLTTYGLMEFTDMSEVWYVDPAVIERTRQWLADDQEDDGSWIPTEGGIAEGAIDRYRNDVLRTTAYVVWSLTHSGYSGPSVDTGLQYVKTQLANSEMDPETYTLALCAHALLIDSDDALLPGLFETFEAKKQVDGDLVWWTGEAPTVTYSRGKGADVELTALLVQAYMRYGAYPGTTEKALNYLAAAKDGNGNFGSTQATVLTLKAFSMAAAGATTGADATVRVSVNDGEAQTIRITDQNSDVLFLVDLQEQTRVGVNQVALTFEGEGSSLYQIVGRYYLPWEQVPVPVEELISITVSYDKTELAANDTVTCFVGLENKRPGTAKMVVADIGIPPGFSVHTDDLDVLVGVLIEKYQIAGRQLIVYLEELDHDRPVTLEFGLTAKFPVRAMTPESVVYEYYNPDIRGVSEPQEIAVTE